jgi:hypothetical protein
VCDFSVLLLPSRQGAIDGLIDRRPILRRIILLGAIWGSNPVFDRIDRFPAIRFPSKFPKSA